MKYFFKEKKIAIIGNTGFIGKSLCKKLLKEKKKIISFNSKNCNLLKKYSKTYLSKKINQCNVIVFISAIAPCKNLIQLEKNIKMMSTFLEAIRYNNISQLVYISSDAVYKDTKNKINENSKVEPNSIHGIMHQTRENILKIFFQKKLTIIRPTLIYGSKDTHNGYGPNKFARNAINNKDIKIFGNGEEIRDHVHINDVVDLIYNVIKFKSFGIFNAVTSKPTSFVNLAKLIIKKFKSKSKIVNVKRNGPMPHGGYRCFDRKKIAKRFANLKPTIIKIGINDLKKIKSI